MKIYAIKDRLIEYFQQPFIGPTDKQVMAAIATAINNPEQMNGITQAPHHFELWSLGEVDEETGRITPRHELLADCSSLVRRSVRGDETDKPGAVTGIVAAGRSTEPPEGSSAGARPGAPSAQNSA